MANIPTVPALSDAISALGTGKHDKDIDAAKLRCPYIPKDLATKVFEVDGKLLLKVGTTKCKNGLYSIKDDHPHDMAQTFRVCPRTMARASVVWRKLLYGGFAESKQPEDCDWIVSLPDDLPQPMTTLLGIVHAKFDQVPSTVKTQELYDIAVLTDKYDLTHMLKPWSRHWIRQAWSSSKKGSVAQIQLLWITWELGDRLQFKTVACDLAYHMPDEDTLQDALAPPGIVERIIKVHEKTVDKLIAPFRKLVAEISIANLSTKVIKTPWYECTAQDDTSLRCNLLVLGYLIHALRVAGLYSASDETIIHGKTASAVASELKKIVSRTPALNNLHRKCSSAKRCTEVIDAIMKKPPLDLTFAQIKHLRAQALKSGLSLP